VNQCPCCQRERKPAATKPFDAIADVQISIVTAATTLIQTEPFEQIGAASNGGLTELRNTIGWGRANDLTLSTKRSTAPSKR
jgi:hypothetical protein